MNQAKSPNQIHADINNSEILFPHLSKLGYTHTYLFFSGNDQCVMVGGVGKALLVVSLEIRIKSLKIAHTFSPNVFTSEKLPGGNNQECFQSLL